MKYRTQEKVMTLVKYMMCMKSVTRQSYVSRMSIYISGMINMTCNTYVTWVKYMTQGIYRNPLGKSLILIGL